MSPAPLDNDKFSLLGSASVFLRLERPPATGATTPPVSAPTILAPAPSMRRVAVRADAPEKARAVVER